MPKPIDPALKDILATYGEDPRHAVWDCHGTWVVYHKAIERIAARAGVSFASPQIIEANSEKKTVAICVTGTMDGRSEWSFGEASPANNKNGYPYAMAEKRAKDRVVLKLVGLHGLAYSEEEADDFKDARPAQIEDEVDDNSLAMIADQIIAAVKAARNEAALDTYLAKPDTKRSFASLDEVNKARVVAAGKAKRASLSPLAAG